MQHRIDSTRARGRPRPNGMQHEAQCLPRTRYRPERADA